MGLRALLENCACFFGEPSLFSRVCSRHTSCSAAPPLQVDERPEAKPIQTQQPNRKGERERQAEGEGEGQCRPHLGPHLFPLTTWVQAQPEQSRSSCLSGSSCYISNWQARFVKDS